MCWSRTAAWTVWLSRCSAVSSITPRKMGNSFATILTTEHPCRCFKFEVINSGLALPSMFQMFYYFLISLNGPFGSLWILLDPFHTCHRRFSDDFVFQWAAGTHFPELWLCHCLLPGCYGCLAEWACAPVFEGVELLIETG